MIKLQEMLGDINHTRKANGIHSAIAQVLREVKERISFSTREYILFSRSLESGTQVTESSAQDIVIRQIKASDLYLFQTIVRPSLVARYRTLLERERSCLVALKDGRIASHVWFTAKTDLATEYLHVPLAPGEVYVFDAHTVPSFRRRGFQFVLQRRMFQLLREAGHKRAFALVQVGNGPSLRLMRGLGYRAVSRLTQTVFLGFVRSQYGPNTFENSGDVITCFSYPIWGYRRK